MVGTEILHYSVLEELEGPAAGTYLAVDNRLGRRVVLEFLHGDFRDEETRACLLHAVHASSKLSHPNLAATYAIEETDGRVFIAREHVRGEPLSTLLERGAIDAERATEIALQILAGLAGAHETGVIHRDLGPESVVVTGSGRVKVLHCGLSTVMGAGQAPSVYASPEQARGARVDHRSDLYSFGVVLYEMLTGRRPFAEERELAPVPDTPKGLRDIVGKALEEDPAQRYQSAVEIEADLARVRT